MPDRCSGSCQQSVKADRRSADTRCVPTTPAATPTLTGSFHDLGTAELLTFLGATGATGRLTVRGELKVCLWWRDGRVVAGDIEAEPDFTDSPAARSARVEAVFQALVMDDAAFAFHPDEPMPVGRPGSDVGSEPAHLLALAEARLERWKVIAAVIPSVASRVSIAPELAEGVDAVTLSRDEFALLALLDGGPTVAEITAALGTGAFETCERLHELVRRGVATVDPHG